MPRKVEQCRADVSAGEVLAWLEEHGTPENLEAMQRFGISAGRAVGVGIGELKRYATSLGRRHELAQELWESGLYDARMLASFVGDPAQVTRAQMEAWAKDFDSWAIVDTVCFALFDRAPDRWAMVHAWASAEPEFTRRAAFALIWSMSVHDKKAPDAAFLDCLPLIEAAASDHRHYVWKGVSMALRAMGKRNPALRAAALATAERLAASPDVKARAVGKEALRELTRRADRGVAGPRSD